MKLGVVMDPIDSINFKKDSTLAMMIEAQERNHEIIYMTSNSLFINSGEASAISSRVEVRNDPSDCSHLVIGRKLNYQILMQF